MHLFDGIICVGQPYVQCAISHTQTTLIQSLTHTYISAIPLYAGGLNIIKMFDNMANPRTYDNVSCNVQSLQREKLI